MFKIKRKTVSKTLKILTIVTSLGGVVLSLFTAKEAGYSHWGRRLLYFTAQSNIWLGVTMLLLLCFSRKRNSEKVMEFLYGLKYIFTVSITLTGLVFCGLLAPFSPEDYTPWTFVNLLTHVFSPVFSVVDFFMDTKQTYITKRQTALCLVPPLSYCMLASMLGGFGVDFGRGVSYPYFFLNYRSPAGIFGFSSQGPFFVGEFYWLMIFGLAVYGIGALYAHIRNRYVLSPL